MILKDNQSSFYAEQGTALSGYEERAPYSCRECQHKLNPSSDLCVHPVVISDPDLRARLVTVSDSDIYTQAIKINLEKGCCSYVNQAVSEVLLVLRHGETNLNKSKKFRAWKNVPLDEHGIEQAEAAAQFLEKYPIKQIYCSPLDRAYHTALFVQEKTKAPIAKKVELLPWNLGELAGKSRADHKEDLEHYIDNPDEVIPEGESLNEFQDRMFKFFDEVFEEASADNEILLVAHTSTCTTLQKWLDNDYSARPETDDESVEPGGVLAVSRDGDGDKYKTEVVYGKSKSADFGS